MKLLNGEIFGAVQSLNKLYDKEWPIRESLALTKLMQVLSAPFEVIEKIRTGLVTKYQNPGGNGINEESPNWGIFIGKYNELMLEKSTVEFTKVVLPLAVDGKDVALSPQAIATLKSFVTFEETKKKP